MVYKLEYGHEKENVTAAVRNSSQKDDAQLGN